MTHASLFSGIGGFDLAAEWAGWFNAFNCEIDSFCRKVLKYHFPQARQYDDIRTTDFTVWQGRIDVLTGGFPCQPFSIAGKRRGTNDDRYLWPEMLRAIREIRPRWIVGENVLGIVNWSQGLVFEQVCADLEAEGYSVQPYILPACGVDAPHRRYRTWFVAHTGGYGRRADSQRKRSTDGQNQEQPECLHDTATASHSANAGTESLSERQELPDRREAAADAYCHRCGDGAHEQECIGRSLGTPDAGASCKNGASDAAGHRSQTRGEGRTSAIRRSLAGFDQFPTQSPICCGDDGLPDKLDGITFPAWRRESIKAYGNAIVPLLFYQIAETINEYEENFEKDSTTPESLARGRELNITIKK